MRFIQLKEDFEYRVDAQNIIKSVLINELGKPILRENLIPKIKDKKIHDSLAHIKEFEEVQILPKYGVRLTVGVIYKTAFGFIKCNKEQESKEFSKADIEKDFLFYGELKDETDINTAISKQQL